MELENYEYYLEIDDVINNSEFDETDLKEIYKDKIDFSLKDASSKVYSIMYSAYRGINKEHQYKGLRHMIINDENKQAIMKKAIIEYVRGDINIGMGLGLYVDTKHYSDEIINLFKRGGLWVVAELQYKDEDVDEA